MASGIYLTHQTESDKKNVMGRRGRKDFDKQGNTYFITTTVINFIKVFSISNEFCNVIINSLKYLIKEHKASLIAYVVMPNHLHLILLLPEGESISNFMRDFKRHTSVKIKELLIFNGKDSLVQKLVELSGTGKYKLWMDRFDDFIVTEQKTLETKINYIHNNPVKAGLVSEMTEWTYSSARNYYLDDNSVIEISKTV